jgi:hypothetical protein
MIKEVRMANQESAPPGRIPNTCFFRSIVLLVSSSVLALKASDYTHTATAIDSAGLRASSADYTADFSSTPGSAHSGADYTARSGHSGQLYDATTLEVKAAPPTLDETSTRQLAADLLFDDGTYELLPATSVGWSILNGPLASIGSGGLATAATVYENTAAVVQGLHAGVSGTLTLNVLESIPDNFRLYAGDRLPDPWQVQFLGLENPLGSQTANPDGDAMNNLLEYAFGTDPANPLSGPGDIGYDAGVIIQRGQPKITVSASTGGVTFLAVFGRRKDYLTAGLTYTVQFSADLTGWQNSTATPSVIASDAEMDAVSVRYPFFLSDGRKAQFFRVRVTIQ